MEQSVTSTPSSKIPVFQSRTEQLIYYATKLACICVDLIKETGRMKDLPDHETLEELLKQLPPEFIISYIVEADEKFGKELEGEQLSAVAKIVALASTSNDVHDLTQDMESFVNKLEQTPALKKKFFCYVKLLRQILHC